MWKVIRASVIGTSHTDNKSLCQDDCFADVFVGCDGAGYLVSIVADGAGSATQGGYGAELTCAIAARSIEASLNNINKASLDEILVEQWVKDIRRRIYDAAEKQNRPARDFACTVSGAVVGPSIAIFFQIGDGSIVVSRGDIQGVVFWPDSGPYANMTYFVTEEDALDHLHVCVTNTRIDEIAMFTDGIQRLALSFEQRTAHLPFFESMFKVLRSSSVADCGKLDQQLAKFLNSEAINKRTDDDKTLIMATRATNAELF